MHVPSDKRTFNISREIQVSESPVPYFWYRHDAINLDDLQETRGSKRRCVTPSHPSWRSLWTSFSVAVLGGRNARSRLHSMYILNFSIQAALHVVYKISKMTNCKDLVPSLVAVLKQVDSSQGKIWKLGKALLFFGGQMRYSPSQKQLR